MQIAFSEIDGVTIVALSGRLTVGSENIFKNEMSTLPKSVQKIVLDCSALEYIDSTGLGLVVRFFKDFTSNGGKLVIAALQAKPKIVFEITRAYKIFDIFDNVELAAESEAFF